MNEPQTAEFNYTCDADQYSIEDKPNYVKTVQEIIDEYPDWDTFLTQTKNYPANKLLCVYKPRIQVLDNWGWCSGDCHSDGGKDGCYNGYEDDVYGVSQECDAFLANKTHWIDYTDIVVVAS